MRIGLINIEPKIINTAYMQISEYHKQQGDTVEWAKPAIYPRYDKLYCSSLFDFTDKSRIPKRAIKGGTGFNLVTQLPEEIDLCQYDYSLYPECDHSIIWLSRGCIRHCPFCNVHEKEGMITNAIPKQLNPKGQYIRVQDNNFFANPDWPYNILWLKNTKQPIQFASGIDLRLLNERQLRVLTELKIFRRIHVAWDNPKDNLIPKLKLMTQFIKPYRITCYVLIGYWSTPKQDLYRVETLRTMGIDPYVMPYDKTDGYQKRFARWVNAKPIFKTVKWEKYSA